MNLTIVLLLVACTLAMLAGFIMSYESRLPGWAVVAIQIFVALGMFIWLGGVLR